MSHTTWQWVISLVIFHIGSPKWWHSEQNCCPGPKETNDLIVKRDKWKLYFLHRTITCGYNQKLSITELTNQRESWYGAASEPPPPLFFNHVNPAVIWPCWVLWLSCHQKDVPYTSVAFPGCTTRPYITPSLFHLISLHTFLLTQLLPHLACQRQPSII